MRKRKSIFFLFLCAVLSASADERSINEDWNFHLGELQSVQQLMDDSVAWTPLNLPHDWAFELGYSKDGAQQDKGGYASGGVGWYYKQLHLNTEEKSATKVFLDFEAVYRNSEVWFNGHYLGKCPYGYLPFSYDITPYLKSKDNLIAVRVDNSLEPSARWYHGCGIYGQVSLRSHRQVYLEKDGTFVHTANSQGSLAFRSKVQVESSGKAVHLKAKILDSTGKEQAHFISGSVTSSQTVEGTFHIDGVQLWSPEHPVLYQLNLQLVDAKGRLLDQQQIPVGFRDFHWTADQGFFLNGKPYKLRGVCEHLEGGPTGAIYTSQLMRWKLQLIKDMGCNAVRTAHNPQLPMFYDLCDEIGLLVMDEVFDGWKRKANYDYGMEAFAQHWENDLRTVIRRDRNHPCIFLYSVGNETRGTMAADLVRVCHQEDSTRLVTSGTAGTEQMDIMGVNGHSEDKNFLETFTPKQQPFIATENPHTWQVRGYYRTKTWYRDGYKPNKMMHIPDLTEQEIFTYDWTSPDKKRNRKQVFNSSYDNATVRVSARHILEALRDKPWFSGSFRWTGFDYLGEAGYVHGGWPFRAFQSGALDLAGFPKDLYYLYQSQWSKKDMVHILPHWSHPMMELGTVIPVWVYTTGDEVELFLNGKSLGRSRKGKAWDEMQCEFQVPWSPGTIEVVAYRQGREIARSRQTTAEAPSRLGISVENPQLKADGKDLSILTLRQEDAQGTLYPYGENRVYVSIDGAARVLSFENGSPVDVECNFNAASRRCFFGLNRLFLQSTGGKSADPVSVVLGVISGDKKLKQSDRVFINCKEVVLRGTSTHRQLHAFYTLDGSEPTSASQRYEGAIALKKPCTVRAVVYDGQRKLFEMSESFGPNEGLYWGKPGESAVVIPGEPAEKMELTDCDILKEDNGAYGKAYVVPHPNKGSLSWYQENDGGKTPAVLTIRYSQQQKTPAWMGLYNNNRLVKKIKFENTGSANQNWKELKVKLILQPGANQFSLRSLHPSAVPSIDHVKID